MRLRPPGADDLDDVFRIHGDPRTNRHNPAGPDPDLAASRARLAEWLEHWQRYGFGYWAVEDDDGAVIGFSGVRHEGHRGQPGLAADGAGGRAGAAGRSRVRAGRAVGGRLQRAR